MDRIIAVNSNCYHGYSIEDALDGIARAGFRYVELTATKGWTEHIFPNQSFEYLQGIKDKMKNLGIISFALSGHTNLMDKERLNDFVMNIKLAKFFDCQYIVSSIGEAHLEDRSKAGDDIIVENIKSLLTYLEEYNLNLVLETHGEHSSGEIISRIVKKINSPRVGINYDTANVIFYGDVLPENDMKKCIDDIKFIHLKDKIGGFKEWNFPAIGKGNVNFEEIFKILDDNKNNSPFSIEIEFTKDGAENLEAVNKAVEDSAIYLKEKGFKL